MWSKNQPEKGRIKIRLDRALASTMWKGKFWKAMVHHIAMSTSDHSLLALRLAKNSGLNIWARKKLFQFEAMWLRDPRCDEVIQEAWQDGISKIGESLFSNSINNCRESSQV